MPIKMRLPEEKQSVISVSIISMEDAANAVAGFNIKQPSMLKDAQRINGLNSFFIRVF